jgi:hypothetical protein
VLLVEAAERLGGQWAVAALAPERPHLGRNLPFLERELARLGVSVRLAEPAGAAAVLDSQPDVVVVATGAANVVPDEARGAAVPCATDVDLLSGAHPIRPGARVIVFDPEGLNRGASIASWAAEVGAGEVELVTPLLAACQDLDPTQQPSALRRLARNGVTCTPNQALVGVADGAVTVRDQWSDAVRALDADLLVFVGFRRARSALEAELRQARPGVEVQAIGDCVAPRRLHDAVAEGARVGRSIGTIVSPRGMAARQARRRHRGPIG